MYKNISFQEAEFVEKKFLMYRVDDAAQMDHVEVEMLKNNDIKGLLPFSSAQNNDEIKFNAIEIHSFLSIQLIFVVCIQVIKCSLLVIEYFFRFKKSR